jgi:broad specificity phosphatase PhoE
MREEPDVWQRFRGHPETFRFPGGESLEAQQRRVLACLRDCALDGRASLLVTHGGSIRLTRSFLEGRGVAAFHATTTANGDVDELDTAGLAARIETHLSPLEGR